MYATILVFVLFLALSAGYVVFRLVDPDRCLDRGGCWVESEFRCEFDDSSVCHEE